MVLLVIIQIKKNQVIESFLIGGILGIGLGRYAGKKITRRIKRKKPLTNEEVLKTKLECLLKWGEFQSEALKLNMNEYRMILEKVRFLKKIQ